MLPSSSLRFLVAFASTVIIIAGLKYASTLLIPFLLAGFVSIICAPFMGWLMRCQIPAWLAVSIIVLTLLGFFVVVGGLVSTSAQSFSDELPLYTQKLNVLFDDAILHLKILGITINTKDIFGFIEPGATLSWLGGLILSLRSLLTNFTIVLFIVAFVLLEANGLPDKLERAFGSKASIGYALQFSLNIKKYFVIKTLISLVTGLVIFTASVVIGLAYPLLWGLIAFFLNYIPNIGSFLAAIPAVIIALVTGGWFHAFLTCAIFIVVNVLIGNIVEPRVMGRNMGLSPLVVFSSLIFWGWILGPAGFLLAVPLSIILNIALESHPDTRWLAVLMSS